MYFHAMLEFGGREHGEPAVNLTREQLVNHIAIPFIAGQVTDVPMVDGPKIINMGSVATIRLYQTGHRTQPQDFYNTHDAYPDCTEEILSELRTQITSPDMRSTIQRTFSPNKKQAFIIMKFGDKHLDSAYHEIVAPAFLKFGLEPVRIDEVQNSGRINDQILNEIASSSIVFADLTGERPNCYYETGFAHALGKELILSIRSDCKIHFDLASNRFIFWETERELREQLDKRLDASVSPSKKKRKRNSKPSKRGITM